MLVLLWVGFIVFVLVMLALDLGVFNRKAHVISAGEALRWTGVCVAIALLFNVAVYFMYAHNFAGLGLERDGIAAMSGKDAALAFFQAYIVEQSLSMDNIFVIAVIFTFFRVPALYQHRVLFWGILGALIMRGAMIGAGVELIKRFEWLLYIFGLLLIWSAFKLLRSGDDEIHPDQNPLVKIARRLYPVTPDYEGEKFFTTFNGKRAITPLFLVLLVIESTDVVFAVDSIPAVIGITRDPFLVFTSNIFAILCLRSMFFALASLLGKFKYLKASLVVILAYVGVKMLVEVHWHKSLPSEWSLAILVGILALGILASVIAAKRETRAQPGGEDA